MSQSHAHFAGWLICPICKEETRHYTNDTHNYPRSRQRRIWCEKCRILRIQFKQSDGQWI